MKRYLIKLSGEVLKGSLQGGLDWHVIDDTVKRFAQIIKETNVQLGFVIGGGNLFRGADQKIANYNRLIGDNIGMMATVINALALMERFKAHGINAIVQSAIHIEGLAPLFNQEICEAHLQSGGVVIFCGGTGNPYFSTDTTAVLRALQIKADRLIKATKVDGIFDRDPEKHKNALKLHEINYSMILNQGLKIMDLSAIQLLKENSLTLQVLQLLNSDSLERAFRGENVGTIVKE